jgi:hypothetical protein
VKLPALKSGAFWHTVVKRAAKSLGEPPLYYEDRDPKIELFDRRRELTLLVLGKIE